MKYLPSEEKDESQFLALELKTSALGSNKIGSRNNQLEAQREDAENRTVAWNAEGTGLTDLDAEGEDDPDYVNDSGIAFEEPLGRRMSDGDILPLKAGSEDHLETDQPEVRFFGKPEVVPSHVGQLVWPYRIFLGGALTLTSFGLWIQVEAKVHSSPRRFSNQHWPWMSHRTD